MIKYQIPTFKKLLLPFHNQKYREISESFLTNIKAFRKDILHVPGRNFTKGFISTSCKHTQTKRSFSGEGYHSFNYSFIFLGVMC